MAVEFLLGRPASKREDVIAEKIAGLVRQDPLFHVLVIVPPQATYATECMLLQKLGKRGMMGLGVMSISRVAQRVLEEVYGGATDALDVAGKSMIIHRILKENAAGLKTFGKMRAKDLLVPQLADIVAEMKQLSVSPQMLRDFPVQSPNTRLKLDDIALLLERFEENTAGLYDTEDRLAMVTEHICEADFVREAHVFVHGFDMYNELTVRFITEVMKTAKHTTLSFLYADGKEPDSEAYGICDENRMRFYEAAKALGLETVKVTADGEKSADILHIEKNIYAFPAKKMEQAKDISLSYAKDRKEEVDGVAAQIAYLTQRCGYRFDEIAVVCGDSEGYLPMMEKRFTQAGIPCYTGKKRTLLESNLADFVLTAFMAARGRLKKDTLLAHMKTGFCQLTIKEQGLLQNYAYSNIRDGFAFLKEFDGEEERARQKLMEPMEALRKKAAKAKQAGQVIECVQDYMESVRLYGQVEAQVVGMREQGWFEDADFLEQAYGKLSGLLEQAGRVLGGEVSGAKIARVLRAGMAAEQIAVIPPAADEVLCADIAGTWLPDIRALFVLGLNESVVPSYAGRTDILTEEERELILGGIKGLKHTGSIDKQRLAVVKAFARPREKLFLSCVRDGKMQPSPLLDRLGAAFGSVRQNDMADIVPLLGKNAWEQTAKCVRNIADGGRAKQCGPVMAAVLRHETYAQKLDDMQQRMQEENEATPVDRFAQQLYGDFNSSATRIEEYYACPYRHFLTYGIRAQRPQEYAIDSLDVGRFAHSALDKLAHKVKESGKQWDELAGQDFSGMVDESLAESKGEHSKYALNSHNETVIRAVSGEVQAVAQAIRMQCGAGALKPQLTEHYFEVEDIHGVVDRIDTAEVDGQKYFGIVDYKTGRKDYELSRMFGGLDLQLFIYILAVQALLGEEYLLGGANYMRVYEAMRERDEALMPLYRMRGIEGASADAAAALFGKEESGAFIAVNAKTKADGSYDKWSEERYLPPEALQTALSYCGMLVERARNRIKAGSNEIRPAVYRKVERACRYCDYKAVCMFGEDGTAREIDKMDKDELLEKMRQELEGHS